MSNQHTRVLLTFLDKVAEYWRVEEQGKSVNLKCSSVSSSRASHIFASIKHLCCVCKKTRLAASKPTSSSRVRAKQLQSRKILRIKKTKNIEKVPKNLIHIEIIFIRARHWRRFLYSYVWGDRRGKKLIILANTCKRKVSMFEVKLSFGLLGKCCFLFFYTFLYFSSIIWTVFLQALVVISVLIFIQSSCYFSGSAHTIFFLFYFYIIFNF